MKKKIKNYRSITRKCRHILGKTLYRPEMDEHEAIFVHIPKAAGTSICRAVFGTSRSSHYTARCYRNDDPDKFARYRKFSVIRNPYERLCSAYRYFINGGERLSAKDALFRDEYLSNFDDINDFVLNGLGDKNCAQRPHFDPQFEYLFDDDQQTLLVDYVEKLEELEQFELALTKLLGTPVNIGHANPTNAGDCKFELSDEARFKIYQHYRKDFELLGYKR